MVRRMYIVNWLLDMWWCDCAGMNTCMTCVGDCAGMNACMACVGDFAGMNMIGVGVIVQG